MSRAGVLVVAAAITACASHHAASSASAAPQARGEVGHAPVAAAPHVAAVVDPSRARDDLPRVVRRLVAEERQEVDDMQALARAIGDDSGRARAMRETEVVERELAAIEAALNDAATQESDRLDRVVSDLATLTRRIETLHELLRGATIGAAAVSLSRDR